MATIFPNISRDEYIELLKYANERNVKIVPEVSSSFSVYAPCNLSLSQVGLVLTHDTSCLNNYLVQYASSRTSGCHLYGSQSQEG